MADERPLHVWPSAVDELLLHAALGGRSDATAAWKRWTARRTPGTLPRPLMRTLPRVAANLRAHGVEDPLFELADEIQRDVTLHNRELMDTALETVELLDRAGIETLALKGVALVANYLEQPGLRAMSDIDLMVPAARLPAACDALQRAGWRPKQRSAARRPFLCAVDFWREGVTLAGKLNREPAGTPLPLKLDLHQYLSEFGSTPSAEAGVWSRAQQVENRGEPLRVEGASDLLLQTCLGSLRFGHYPNLRWALDSQAILARGAVDWGELASQIDERGVGLPMRVCLRYLNREFGMPIPNDLLFPSEPPRELSRQRRTYRALTRPVESLPQLAREYVRGYRFGVRAQGRAASPIGFARFVRGTLEDVWGVDGWPRLLAHAAQRLWRRTAARGFARRTAP